MSGPSLNKEKKSTADLLIERAIELYGFNPEKKSDENLEWMRKHGFLGIRAERYRRGTRGRRSKSELF